MKNTQIKKIAFIILAHSDVKQLNVLIHQLLSYDGSYIFVHIDKKAPYSKDSVTRDDRVVIDENRIDGKWGDISLVEITLSQLKRVADSGISFEYVSLHSGADMAVRPIKSYIEYLLSSGKEAYIDCSKLPTQNWGHGGGLERVHLIYPKFFRQRVSKWSPIRFLRVGYQMAYKHRIIPANNNTSLNINLFGGSQWFTCKYTVAGKLLRYIESNRDFMRYFRNSLIPDEIFFVTLINLVCDRKNLELKNNLRYIDWRSSSDNDLGGPRTLTANDIGMIDRSGSFFARKFSSSKDTRVVDYYLEKSLIGLSSRKKTQ
jgi:hypothetical protein